MANKEQNKISCRSGRTRLVDPNLFQGQSSSNNIPVQLEDLNISVQLETYRKGRSVLIADNDKNRTESNSTVTVRFIEGQTLPSGKKVLTTKFTDLTTVFDATNPNNDEALGISSIDIDFNSAYAPLITINFIDVRGSAIFQNENNLKNGSNKYSTFFELPYPLYQLTIKGYYGKPVRYCLHMTKFNSRFNSQTGNFEITASFIGYTYAMLSDMLMGYLKVISNTKQGAEIYNALNNERKAAGLNEILTINSLVSKLSEVNELIDKTASDSPASSAIDKIDKQVNKLREIETAIQEFGYDLEKNSFSFDIREKYPIIVTKNTENVQIEANKKIEQDLKKLPEDLTNLNQSSSTLVYTPNTVSIPKEDINTESKEDKNFIQERVFTYEDKINTLIQEFNKIGGTTLLDFNDFSAVSLEHFFKDLTKNEFDETKRTTESDNILKNKLINAPNPKKNTDYDVFTYKVKEYGNILFSESYESLGSDVVFAIYDMTYAYEKINETLESLSLDRQLSLQQLASELDIAISKKLGISPTIRSIVEVFTTSVEVFLKLIYRVSVSAEQSSERKKVLKNFFGDNSSSSSDLINSDNIFPWPAYVENSETGYIEKYLGSVKTINDVKDVIPELTFIDELYKAFLAGAQQEKNEEDNLKTIYKNWIPVNPLDSKIFINESPYERLKKDKSDINKVIVTMLTRAMIFLGYSNKNLTPDEIKQMSNFEANLINRLPDDTLKAAMAKKTVDDFLNFKVDIDSKSINVLGVDGNNHYYNLLFDGSSTDEKLLPIIYKEYNQWDKNETYTVGQTNNYFAHSPNYYPKQNTFLTNYSSNSEFKPNDGGLYVQILSKDQYAKQKTDLIEEVNTESVILLDKIKNNGNTISDNLTSAGYNTFGGPYGIQEYSKMNFGGSEENGGDLAGLPLMYVFYSDSFGEGKILDNALANSKYNSTNFDYNISARPEDEIGFRDGNDDALNPTKRKSNGFDNFGKNRALFNTLLKSPDKNKITYPYIKQELWSKNDDQYYLGNNSFSLFGSLWYYSQTNEATKALLFLNTLPFNNTLLQDNRTRTNGFNQDADGSEIFSNVTIEAPSIINLFNQKAGFIRAPRLWCAYIGGILWRAEQDSDIIIWETNGESIFPGIDDLTDIPSTKDYIKNITPSTTAKTVKVKVNEILLNLPTQVKEEFKRVFFDFVNGSDTNVYTSWPTLKNKLEIWGKSGSEFKQTLDNIYYNIDETGQFLKGNLFEFKNLDNYSIVTVNKAYEDSLYRYTMYLELYGNYAETSRTNKNEPTVVKLILDAMMQDVVIANNNYKIWETPDKNDVSRSAISVNTETLKTFLNNLITNISSNYQDSETEKRQLQQEIFASTNENVIKLQLYRTCKNIYDKWVGGVKSEDGLLFQCGSNTDSIPRRNIDTELAKRIDKNRTPSFIDSFRFVSRSFNDIGDKFYINPLPMIDLIRNNPNASFYDIVSGLLSDNYFDFIALPNFIDYTNDSELSKVFEPFDKYETAIEGGICGPSFVCVYVGQTSKNLDFNNNPNTYYSNDGFDFNCSDATLIDLPNDFSTEKKSYEDPVAVFAVNFGQQNQNIFKDVVLDQSEFGETAESLKIVNDISNKGAQNNVTLAGQNIYNVYSVRSYKAEIEMLGNAMIQPMMYFQLNNIPMFHGAYMITHVKHAIKPNYMSTHFTGVRIKKSETPLLTASDLYMKMLQSLGFEINDGLITQGTTGNYTLGLNPGEYTLPKQIVDGAEGYYNSKPIRDLVATVESGGNYDAYNNGFAGRRGTIIYKPSQMTIAEIKAKQAMGDSNRIFAVGKYQLIPDTFNSMVKALGFGDNDIFDADKQEKAGEWLILKGAGYRKGLINYFGSGSLGGETDLQNAISDLALEFASFPTYHGTTPQEAFSRVNPIGYNSKTALYGGSAGNPAEAKFCAQDVAKALIATWKNLNPGREPSFTYDKIVSVYNQGQDNTEFSNFNCDNDFAKITANMDSTTIVMGDSNVSVLAGKPNGFANNNIDVSVNCVGKTVKWLVDQLKNKNQVYANVKNVFVIIGANDGYAVTTTARKNVKELNEIISKKYPNAKKRIFPGTYGWGNVSDKTKQNQDEFYSMFVELGWIYVYPDASAFFNTQEEAHDPNTEWRKKSLELIISLSKT